ncbi:hypothetical protein ILUMI_22847 [Ignelater luminosus]|uniref:Tudor domain-containing protein n=1 Tax=Ignelater luminosus TaxID=2038154 RepID=A0A8K0CGD2_IGNLU|nr:hypothetical protein ILUMI_22847 [Ignelater luminosus]
MKIIPSSKSVTLFVGISLCGVTGYLLYLLFKKDDEDDDYLSTFPKKCNFKTIEVQIPKEMVRVLIGRNGKNIKLIEEQSNTRINFKEEAATKTRLCVIRGTSDACVVAENLIQEFIDKQPIVECADMWVPQMAVGRIIGRCGEQITEIIAKSGAKINVGDGDRTEPTRRIILRGTQEQINIAKSLIEELVEQSQLSQSHIESTLAKREPRGPAKSPSPKPPIESPKVEKIFSMPGQPDSQFEVYVSAMLDPSRFWLQIVGPKATELDQLVEEMTDYYSKQDNRDLHILNAVECGDLVAAIFKFDGKWYRAEVLNIEAENGQEASVELYYVDYGDTDKIPYKDVYELRTDFLRLNFQAIECYLARVEPKGETWTEEAKDKFEEWTHVAQWKKLSARMNGYCVREKTRAKREGSPVPGIDLYDVNNDHDIDIAQELVNHGYAMFKKDADLRSTSSRTTSGSNISVDSNT